MAKQESFNKASKNAAQSMKTAGFKGATNKLTAVNLAAELKKRGIEL